jgi:hypothetical protein
MTERYEELLEQATEDVLGVPVVNQQLFATLMTNEIVKWIDVNVGMMDEDATTDLAVHLGLYDNK